MRVVVQRVTRASVTVGDQETARIGRGFLLLVGATHGDNLADCEFLARKVAHLRIFDDDAGSMNRSALELNGDLGQAMEALVVSQFTLFADTSKGRRPSFAAAASPDQARPLVEQFVTCLRTMGLRVETGRFGAHMAVELLNDGPVTIWLDSNELWSAGRLSQSKDLIAK